MTITEWEIRGAAFGGCNCDWGCPCQFSALPTHGNCQGFGAYRIDEGHHGAVRLDGLNAAVIYAWPGAIHEGGGVMQVVIDERADEAQFGALDAIMHGRDSEPFSTMLAVFAAMSDRVLPVQVLPIAFEVDVEERTAKLSIPGIIESTGEPIRSPVSGAIQRARIELPNGFEYTVAEMGSGTTRATGEIALLHDNTYGQFTDLHLSHAGVVR